MKKISILLLVLFVSISSNAYVIDLTTAGTAIGEWTITDATLNEEGSDKTNGKYAYDIKMEIPGIAYVTEEPNVQFITQNNTTDKSKAFYIQTGKYFSFSIRTGTIRIKNTSIGDTILLTVASKGSSSASFSNEDGGSSINAEAISTVLTLPAKDKSKAGTGDYDAEGYAWKVLEYRSLGGDVEIMEGAAGFCVKKVVVKPVSQQVNYDDVLIGDLHYTLNPDNKTAQVRRGDNTPKDVIIPSSLLYEDEEYSVVGIADHAFGRKSSLVSVTIPSSVKSIGKSAFNSCENLVSVTVSSGVTEIGEGAFAKCSSLPTITIPNSVTNLGAQLFSECYSLTSINVATDHPNYCSIDGVLFNKDATIIIAYPNGKQGAYVIPDGVERIENSAFMYCDYLTSVEIPNTVQTIGELAFCLCRDLTSVSMSNSVLNIEKHAFRSCKKLKLISCESTTPPSCEEEVFLYVNKRAISLRVPAGSEESYASANEWKDLLILPNKAPEVTVAEPTAEPTSDGVVIEWPKNENAETYAIDITKENEAFCSLAFNTQGQLLTIAYAAPARNGNSRQTPAAVQTSTGWQYTISGLDPGTDYSYTVIAKRSDDSEVYKETVPFKTEQAATGVETITNDQSSMTNKVLRNGQILILRGEKTYTLQGQEAK